MHPLRAARWSIALVAFGCSEGAPNPAIVPGTPCASDNSYCDGWDALTQCMDGRWTAIDCVDACGGAPAGCLVHGASDRPRASCECEEPLAESTTADTEGEVESACSDLDVLIVCDADGCTSHDCADVCADTPDHPMSLGCRAGACACTAIGTACALEEPARCESDGFLIACVEGYWVAIDCRLSCTRVFAECTYGMSGVATCDCLA